MRGTVVSFGNSQVDLEDILRVTTISGASGELRNDQDTLYLRLERATYTREEVLELITRIAFMCPDECDLRDGELRLWWD